MRTVGGARRGLGLWLLQRASALYLVLFLPVFLLLLWRAMPLDYAAWRALFTPLAMKLATLLAFAALLLHAWIGLREIFIDYLRVLPLRLAAYFLFGALYLACLAWAADILWSVG